MIVAFSALLIALLSAGSSFGADEPGSAPVVYEFGNVPPGSCTILEPESRLVELREGDPRASGELGAILRDQTRSVQQATIAAGGNAVLIVRQFEAIGLDGVQTYATDAYSLRCEKSER